MHSKIIVLFALLCLGWSHDITIGSNTEGRKIFDEIRQASPAIWRQYENVTIIAPEGEIIGGIFITDMRPEKDGDAEIVDGGEGKKSATIELKSPTVLRGYEFHIEVYSVPETVSTDAEEHLSPDELNISPENNDKTTDVPDNVTSEDALPIVVEDVKADNGRPVRKTEDENDTQTQLPEDKTTTNTYETSSYAEIDEPTESLDEDKTTELPEVSIKNVPATVLNDENFRPVRETLLHTSIVGTEYAVTDSDNTATESGTNYETTESDITTISSDAQATPAPPTFDNSKDIPDYSSLNILDYIKNRERPRPHRDASNVNQASIVPSEQVQTDENISTTPLTEEDSSMNPTDDTVDLVPPKIDASYNSGFDTNSETAETPIEVSKLYNNGRAGRGIDFNSGITTSEYFTSTPTIDIVSTTVDNENSTTITWEDEQLRNTRDARKDPEYNANEVNISEEKPQNTDVPKEGRSVPEGKSYGNVIYINADQLITKDGNNKYMYTLPIVLIIGSENNFPIIKIIPEESSDELNNVNVTQISDEPIEANEDDYKSIENEKIEDNDFMPSGDSAIQQSQ